MCLDFLRPISCVIFLPYFFPSCQISWGLQTGPLKSFLMLGITSYIRLITSSKVIFNTPYII